ncbi:MAG TPA: c-type cytochrome [Chitinophagaceae bacterium]
MRKVILIPLTMAVLITAVVIACTDSGAKETNVTSSKDSAARVKRGEYLVNTIGCDDCHSPKHMGPGEPEIIQDLRLSGFPRNGHLPPVDTTEIKKGWMMFAPDLTAAVGPWGASFAGNLTNHETGIANWTEENFIRALRKGKLKGMESSRNLLPPMPWFVYKNMTDEDLKSIFAYLKTTKPVDNVVPAPIPFSDLK